jgi:alanine-glyoxylate transaminase/serine-glyoxylate transaminase/serine-pyruvate transaminase
VLEPLAELAQVWRSDRCVVIADVSHTLGAIPILADAWGLDAAFGSSHLALGLPPGLSFAVTSPRLLDRLRVQPGRGWALDLLRHAAAAERGRALHAPNPQLMGALLAQLGRIEAAGGPETLFERHVAHRARVDAWAARIGANVVAAAGRRAPTLTLVAPGHRRAGAVLHEMRLRGFTLATPLDDSSDGAVAFGHMGDLAPASLDAMLDALEASLLA